MLRPLCRTTIGIVASLIIVVSTARAADSLGGTYRDDRLSLDLAAAGEGYAGTIKLGQQSFPVKARLQDGRLSGTFASGGSDHPFTAILQNDSMTLVTGKTTYNLKRVGAPAAENPLDTAGAKAAAPAVDDAPTGYAIVQTTPAGKALTIDKPGATTVRAAMESTLADLRGYFGTKPTVTGAYEDVRDHRSGIAAFSATSKGQPIKGFVSARLEEKGARVAVILCKADATPADWAKLTAAPPAAAPNGAGAPAGEAAAPQVALREYRFADNTGSVGIAEGWRTTAQSCLRTFDIDGPADQKLSFGVSYSINTPNSTAVRLARQYPVPGAVMLVAPYSSPVDALQILVPQLSAVSQKNGGPAVEIDHVAKVQDLTPILPNSRSAVVSFGVTRTTRGQRKHYQSVAQISTTPLAAEAWMMYATQATAPDETAKQDFPVMFAMVNSWRTNDRLIQQKSNEAIADSNRRFAAQQQSHKELTAAYDRYNENWRKNQNTQSRSNDDFDEVIRGYRTVEDTRTGEKTSVNLGNVDQIVDGLNAADPGRYKQIPLRDESDPLPGR